jgi:LPS sulfotransferase NodH
MLNQHPRVDLRGEVLGRTRGRCAAEMVDEVFTRQIPLVRVAGFKVFYEHPIDDDSGELWDWLEQVDKLHVIHLRRQNILRSVLSLKLAQRTGRWGVRRGNLPATLADEPAIALDADELRQAFQQTRAFEAQARRRFAAKAMLEVRYRELTADAEAAYRRITDFLGIPYIQPKIRLQKQARRPLCEAIANYAQLQAAFAGTEWSRFFED